MNRFTSIAVLCVFIAVPVRADLVLNGSFEQGVSMVPGHIHTLGPDSSDIDDWTVIGGTKAVDYICGYWQTADGQRTLDLNGNPGPGGVEQVISTISGATYLVEFYMAGNPGGGLATKTMDVSAIGNTTQSMSFSFVTTGYSVTNMGWTPCEWTFTADADATTLQFMSTMLGSYGPTLDMVQVSVVPVPAAVLLGMLGLGVTGLQWRKFV